MSSFDYINRAYDLSLGQGSIVEYTGDKAAGAKRGTVTSAEGQYINVRFDGDKRASGPFHPTWEMRQVGGAS